MEGELVLVVGGDDGVGEAAVGGEVALGGVELLGGVGLGGDEHGQVEAQRQLHHPVNRPLNPFHFHSLHHPISRREEEEGTSNVEAVEEEDDGLGGPVGEEVGVLVGEEVLEELLPEGRRPRGPPPPARAPQPEAAAPVA